MIKHGKAFLVAIVMALALALFAGPVVSVGSVYACDPMGGTGHCPWP